MKLFAVVVLVLACFPVLLDCFSSGRPALDITLNYPTGTPAPSAALNTGRARVDVPEIVHHAHPDNRGFLDSTVSISTAVPITPPHSVPFHFNLAHWLRIGAARFIGGVIAVFQYSLFLVVGLAFLRKQLVHVLPPQPEPVVVPIPVGPAGPVIECRVPDTRAPVPPAKPPRRPMLRRPFLNPSISRLGGPMNNTAPQPVAPVQPPRRGCWIELVSIEGKLVLCSHHTGPGGSLEWTVQYFPRHEHSYYLSQYPASPRVNPLLELLPSSHPLVVKGPGAIMAEVSDYIFSTSGDEPEFDATSVPLPLSGLESIGGSTSMEMIESSSALTLTPRPDSGSEAAIASSSSSTANANTDSAESTSLSLPYLSPATRRRHSCPSLQIDFADAPSQQGHSSRRMSVAFEQMPSLYLSRPETSDDITSIDMIESSNILTLTPADSDSETVVGSTADTDSNSVVAGDFPLPHLKPAARRRHSFPNLRAHATCQQDHSSRRASIAGEQMERLSLFRAEGPDGPTSIDMMESPNAPTLTRTDSDFEAVVASTADADANLVEASYVSLPLSLPHFKPATRRRHSYPNLPTRAPSPQSHSSRRLSVAFEQMACLYISRPETSHEPTSIDMIESSNTLTLSQPDSNSETVVGSTARGDANSVEKSYVPLPHLKPATRRRHSCPDLRLHLSHAPSHEVDSSRRVSIAVEQMPRPYLTRPRHAPQHLVDSAIEEANLAAEEDGENIKEEVKFKFRRGGKRNTARKHRRQMQDQDQGNPGAGPSSAN